MKLYLDTREPLRKMKKIFKQLGIPITIKKSDVGDIWNSSAIVERKTINDFWSSVTSKEGRLDRQLKNMYDDPRPALLAISGVPDPINFNNPYYADSFLGAIGSSLARYYPLPIVMVPTDYHLAYVSWKFISSVYEGKLGLPRKMRLKTNSDDRRIQVLSTFFGLSPKVCRKLIKRFGSMEGIFVDAKKKELLEIHGIGPVKSKEIYNFIHRKGWKKY